MLAKAGLGVRFNEHMEGDGPTVFAGTRFPSDETFLAFVGSMGLWPFVPYTAIEQPPRLLLVRAPPLLEMKGHSIAKALVPD